MRATHTTSRSEAGAAGTVSLEDVPHSLERALEPIFRDAVLPAALFKIGVDQEVHGVTRW